jgi:hypothetical protein
MTLVPPRRVVRRFAAAAPPASGCWSGAGVAAKRSRWRQRRERSDGRQAGLRARVDDPPSRPRVSPGESGSGAPQVSVRRRIRSLRRRVRDGYISLSAHGHARPRLAHRELRARGIRDPGGRLLLTGDRSPGLSSIERRETLWGAQTRSGSRGRTVFVNEPTEAITSVDAERIGRSSQAETGSRLWRDEPKTAMRTMAVVMIDVDAEDALELAAAGDQDPVQAFAPHRADKRSA